jgi:hypothetical protein
VDDHRELRKAFLEHANMNDEFVVGQDPRRPWALLAPFRRSTLSRFDNCPRIFAVRVGVRTTQYLTGARRGVALQGFRLPINS